MNENKKCQDCDNLATVIHYDCCELESTLCDNCNWNGGQTTSCDWWVMDLSRKVIASYYPQDIGEQF